MNDSYADNEGLSFSAFLGLYPLLREENVNEKVFPVLKKLLERVRAAQSRDARTTWVGEQAVEVRALFEVMDALSCRSDRAIDSLVAHGLLECVGNSFAADELRFSEEVHRALLCLCRVLLYGCDCGLKDKEKDKNVVHERAARNENILKGVMLYMY